MMNTALRSYYLSRLGISEWVERNAQPPVEATANSVASTAPATVVDLTTIGAAVRPLASPIVIPSRSAISAPATIETASERISDSRVTAPGSQADSGINLIAAAALVDDISVLMVHHFTGTPGARLAILGPAGSDPRGRMAAGSLLEAMLASIGIALDKTLVCGVAREFESDAQALQQSVIFVLGQMAAMSLFNRPINLAQARGKVHSLGSRRCVVSYHPDELKKNPSLKRLAWQDLRLLATVMTAF